MYRVLKLKTEEGKPTVAGEIEIREVFEEEDKNGNQYISFFVTGLSPIMVAWEEATALNSNEDGDIPIDDNDGIIDIYVLLTEDDGVDSGDDSNMIPWLLIMMTALTAGGVTVLGRKYHRN